jgi:hypothetical protein
MTKIEYLLLSFSKISTANTLNYLRKIMKLNHKLKLLFLTKRWRNKYWFNVWLLCALEIWWCKMLHRSYLPILNQERVIGAGVAQTHKILIQVMLLWYCQYFQ